MERLDSHLTSEGCNTFSMVKTSGKAHCAPYYKNKITYSTSVYYYYKSLPSKSLTITFMWRLPIPRDAPWRISILISIITMLLLLPARASEQGNVIGLVSVYIYVYIYIYMSSKKICN